jgi:hypothetical protein
MTWEDKHFFRHIRGKSREKQAPTPEQRIAKLEQRVARLEKAVAALTPKPDYVFDMPGPRGGGCLP